MCQGNCKCGGACQGNDATFNDIIQINGTESSGAAYLKRPIVYSYMNPAPTMDNPDTTTMMVDEEPKSGGWFSKASDWIKGGGLDTVATTVKAGVDTVNAIKSGVKTQEQIKQEEEKKKKTNKILMWSVIGFVVVIIGLAIYVGVRKK